jgi:cysteine desulfurase / selenocysteine lyase
VIGFRVEEVRRDFPVLAREVEGKPLVYLDSAATSQSPRPVLAAMAAYHERFRANVHRGDYLLATEATAAYEAARDSVARFLNAESRQGVIFTKNCTEAINLVAHGWARRRLRAGDEVLITLMEHHSNWVPWQMLSRDLGVTLRVLPLTPDGGLDLSRLSGLCGPRTRLIAVSGMSNVLGTVNDLEPLRVASRAIGARLLVDAAQLVAHERLDVQRLGADFTVFSGHKMLGPTGIGALVARPEALEEMEPFMGGGEMIRDVTLEGATWNDPPYRFEAGTPPIAEAIGLGAAVDYLGRLGLENIRRYEARLTERGLAILAGVTGLRLHGPPVIAGRGPIFSFNLEDRRGVLIHPHDVGTLLGAEGIAIRTGHHCAKPLMRHHLQVAATCRASCSFYNTEAELQRLAESLERARAYFDRGAGAHSEAEHVG